MMKNTALAACWLIASLAAQTRIDLQNQSKNVNLKAAPFTGPVKSGSVLPANCSVADLFFQTAAPAGANIYGCTSTNTWSLEGIGGGSGGIVVIDSNGALVGSEGTLNFITGTGIQSALSDTGSQINIQFSVDSAVVLSRANHQSGQTLSCASSSGSSSTYTCALTPSLNVYTTGMVLDWIPDISTAGGATTLNVDTLAAVPVKLSDGVSDPVLGDIIAGAMHQIWYDGTVFRLMKSTLVSALTGAQPTCSSSLRGRIWTVFGATGVKDSVTVCAKDATNTYAWRVIY